MLDIIVTHYKEPWEVGKPLFDILGLQRGINFAEMRVLLVNDGEENHLPDELFKEYPYRVEQIDITHGGVSAARNAGMDHATAEWINFCDFDDTYTNVYALRDVMNVLPNPNYDMLWADCLSENFNENEDGLVFIPERAIFVFLHGKYYRRSWLVESGLRFDPDFRFQEDSLFNALVLAILDYHRIGRIKAFTPPFAWCRRNGSVTLSGGPEDVATMFHFMRNVKVCEYYIEHLPEDRIRDMVVRSTYDAYLMANSKTGVTEDFRLDVINRFGKFIRKYDKYYGRPEDDILLQIEDVSRYELEDKRVPTDYETVTMWKDMVKGEI